MHTHTHMYIYIYTYTTNDAHVSASVSQDKKGGKTQSRMSVRYDMSFSLLSHLIPRYESTRCYASIPPADNLFDSVHASVPLLP